MSCHSDKKRTLEQKIQSLHEADGWMINQLKQWHMTVFPASLLKYAPIKTYERLISEILGTQCEIRNTAPNAYIIVEVGWN